MQLDMTNAKNVLRLIADGSLSNPELRRNMLQEAAAAVLGKDPAKLEVVDGAPKVVVVSEAEQKATAQDLLRIAEASEPPPKEPAPAPAAPKAEAASLPDDEGLKDRISRIFMSSPAFRICTVILGVATALFGVQLGFLSLDVTAVQKIKAEASTAVNDAKAQADNARNAVAAATADIQQSKPSIDIVASKAADKIDIGDARQRVVALLGEKFDGEVRTRIDLVVKELGQKAAPLKTANDELEQKLQQQTASVKTNTGKLAALEEKYSAQLALFEKQQGLISRWESAVSMAEKTAADQTMARFLWMVLRYDAWILISSFGLSILAVFLAAVATWKAFRR